MLGQDIVIIILECFKQQGIPFIDGLFVVRGDEVLRIEFDDFLQANHNDIRRVRGINAEERASLIDLRRGVKSAHVPRENEHLQRGERRVDFLFRNHCFLDTLVENVHTFSMLSDDDINCFLLHVILEVL